MKVLNNDGEIEDFQPIRIKNKLLEETDLSNEEAERIKNNVVKLIHQKYEEEISTSTIRSLITNQPVKKGYVAEEEGTRKLGMSVKDFEALVTKGCKDNANIQYSPEMVSKYAYDSIAKEYSLLKMPKDCAEAHKEGYYHIHDLEFYHFRPNCMNYDIRFFAKNGLKIDGKGIMGSVAKPAKSLEVLINHLLQAFMSGAVVFSGGQGLSNFNTFLSPYCKGRTYKEIKQAIQSFVYNCNMSLVCRGGQVLFSSIGLDMRCPDILKDEPAISIGGIPQGTYKDYQEEADQVFRAVLEVSSERDGMGNYHRFPNILFHIREGDLDKYEGTCKLLHEYGANNPTLYYVNCTDMERTVMGCRTALPMNYRGTYDEDCLNTGNFMYNTLNLPLIAKEAEDEDQFYKDLDYYCELIYKSLHHRRSVIEKVLYEYHMSDFLLQTDKDTGEPLYDLDRATYTIGFCGLNEALMELYVKNIITGEAEGLRIVQFLNDKRDEFKGRDGLRWSVIGSPAESTAGRFAEINKKKHDDAIVNGVKGSYYLTNSSHIPVHYDNNIIEHIKNADKFHPLSMGGNLLHIWSGEVWSDPEAIWKLNKKILSTGTKFWAYSKVFTFCRECQFTINDNIEVCPICKSTDLITYDRITGYYLPTLTYGNSKQAEFRQRYRHRKEELG